MEFNIDCKNVNIEPSGSKYIQVSLSGVEKNEFLNVLINEVKLRDLIDVLDIDEVLDEIGESRIREFLKE